MTDTKTKAIRDFCKANSDPEIIKKYQKYFKEGYDGYGIDDKAFKGQIEIWLEQWKDEMTIESYLDLGDELMKNGRFEEKHVAISIITASRSDFSKHTFDRVSNWFAYGINNWATTDVLCMLVLSGMLHDKVIGFEDLKAWIDSGSEWQRRAIPVALVELDKLTKCLNPIDSLELIEPLMLDKSEYVQKGIGTLLRGLWKKHPADIEDFLLKRKDQCARLIVQYSTEKMDKEYRKKFRKRK
ncbi:DNA alkylation repair protein [Carboxylicivirga sp. M1479]|uniref:DNA alkylation repair protein n=1 Tax=Carboxylicivirga sp. M1479 TaxID=2594476 RepID=UPI0011784596|nr:DNA alkylation repair protein [Carboxylicivirga sp. M1479]TRX70485.1 DNA alkylation repair protein [Carboxylicivirga sp. M1479]